jgi:hypothetical protein
MIQDPVTSAGPILFIAMASGKFQGQIAAMIPSGICVIVTFTSSLSSITSSSKGS